MSMPEIEKDIEYDQIQQALAGDLDAFNDLVRAYQDRIYSVSYRIMGVPDLAADASQETFITAYRKLASYRGGSFKAWLTRIATNTCYDMLRYHKRRPATSFEDLPDADRDDGPALPGNDETPEQAIQRAELNAAIQDCITALGEDYRVMVVLCDVEGYSYKEIAGQTSVALGTVKSRISRARASLRECLQQFRELLPTEYRQ